MTKSVDRDPDRLPAPIRLHLNVARLMLSVIGQGRLDNSHPVTRQQRAIELAEVVLHTADSLRPIYVGVAHQRHTVERGPGAVAAFCAGVCSCTAACAVTDDDGGCNRKSIMNAPVTFPSVGLHSRGRGEPTVEPK